MPSKSIKIVGRSLRHFLLPLSDPESLCKLSGIHHILLLPKQKTPIGLCDNMMILCLIKIDCYQKYLSGMKFFIYRVFFMMMLKKKKKAQIIFLKQIRLFHNKIKLTL